MARTHSRRIQLFSNALARIGRLPESEAGATAVEYSLLVAFIATVIIGAVIALGEQLIPGFQAVIDGL
ncbi:Flp family type IVb pilin [Arthrobacter sp. ISL-5]|uniref:Flp family type IVb pilin n=1 Tax=Arthrobacter sp. ISL-5 TaxID=2819111 RepID=UPI0027E19B8A|nr:Flp family type IVb pilin [Arthrobacter sp. ISL-5]